MFETLFKLPKNIHLQCVCLTNFIWRSTSNPKCHVTFSSTKMNVSWHLHFLLKCYMNATCLVVRVISISQVSIDVWIFFFMSHTTCQNLNCVCQSTCNVFLCKFLRVKCQKTCKKIHTVHMCIEKQQLVIDTISISVRWHIGSLRIAFCKWATCTGSGDHAHPSSKITDTKSVTQKLRFTSPGR